ncbi:MAG: hypothetical protein HFG80_12040 [Eubacterium sp.]|nr:hypothetical protein [Eubacterium sp.]
MLKIIGALLVAVAFFWASHQICRDYRSHITIWRAFYDSLLLMRSEIIYMQTPLPEVMRYLGEKGPPQLQEVFAQAKCRMEEDCTAEFGEIWKQTVAKADVFIGFTEEETEFIEAAGNYLGQADSQIAKERLLFCLKETEKQITGQEKKIAEKQKVARALSALAAGLVILVFI